MATSLSFDQRKFFQFLLGVKDNNCLVSNLPHPALRLIRVYLSPVKLLDGSAIGAQCHLGGLRWGHHNHSSVPVRLHNMEPGCHDVDEIIDGVPSGGGYEVHGPENYGHVGQTLSVPGRATVRSFQNNGSWHGGELRMSEMNKRAQSVSSETHFEAQHADLQTGFAHCTCRMAGVQIYPIFLQL